MKYGNKPLLPLLLVVLLTFCVTMQRRAWAAPDGVQAFLPEGTVDGDGDSLNTPWSSSRQTMRRSRRDILIFARGPQFGFCENPARWCQENCPRSRCACDKACGNCPMVCVHPDRPPIGGR